MSRGVVMQVNVSNGGVPKLPVATATVGRLGIEGDKHIYRLHGGAEKALLMMPSELIDALAQEGFGVYYGALGENLTIRGLPQKEWRAGQRYRVGSVLIELTEMRAACGKLNRFGAGIQERIQGESGFYAAVLENGVIQAGDTIQLVDPVVDYALF